MTGLAIKLVIAQLFRHEFLTSSPAHNVAAQYFFTRLDPLWLHSQLIGMLELSLPHREGDIQDISHPSKSRFFTRQLPGEV